MLESACVEEQIFKQLRSIMFGNSSTINGRANRQLHRLRKFMRERHSICVATNELLSGLRVTLCANRHLLPREDDIPEIIIFANEIGKECITISCSEHLLRQSLDVKVITDSSRVDKLNRISYNINWDYFRIALPVGFYERIKGLMS